MKLKDLIHLKGEVLIQAIDENGKLSTLVDDRNLIVSSGRNNICNFLTHTNTSSYIYDIAFGSGGTITGNSSIALPVNSTDISVNTAIPAVNGKDYLFSAVAEESPSPRAVFSIIVPTIVPSTYSDQNYITYLNGKAISELALMLNTTPPIAFAIKRFPSISKSDIVSLIIKWTIFV